MKHIAAAHHAKRRPGGGACTQEAVTSPTARRSKFEAWSTGSDHVEMRSPSPHLRPEGAEWARQDLTPLTCVSDGSRAPMPLLRSRGASAEAAPAPEPLPWSPERPVEQMRSLSQESGSPLMLPRAALFGNEGDVAGVDAQEEDLMKRLRLTDCSVKNIRRESQLKKVVAKPPWTQSNNFNFVVGSVIVANALSLGLEADYSYEYKGFFTALEHIFASFFVLELILHFWVGGVKRYFKDRVNWLDFGLVVMSVADIWIVQQIGFEADMKLVSLMRLLRLARLARLLRLFRMFKELTLIIEGFIGGFRALTWAMVFLLIMVYIFAIFARLQIGARYVCGDGEEVEEQASCPAEAGGGSPVFLFAFNEEIGDQKKLFGSIQVTMLTLFVCLTEGCGIDVIHPTVRVSPVLSAYWIVFVLLTTFGVLNLIIGLFCENTMKIALETERDIAKSQEETRRKTLENLKRAFVVMDQDGSGEISREEFLSAMADDVVANALTELGLDEEEDLFASIDADKNGSLAFEEFFEGVTMIMKGQDPALAKDMVATYLRVTAVWKAHMKLDERVTALQEDQAASRQTLSRIEQHLCQLLEMQPRNVESDCV